MVFPLFALGGFEKLNNRRRDNTERLDIADADHVQKVAGQAVGLRRGIMTVLKTVDSRQQAEAERCGDHNPETKGTIQQPAEGRSAPLPLVPGGAGNTWLQSRRRLTRLQPFCAASSSPRSSRPKREFLS